MIEQCRAAIFIMGMLVSDDELCTNSKLITNIFFVQVRAKSCCANSIPMTSMALIP